MKNNTSEIEKILKFDPLAEAEKMTGKSYKDDEATSLLGLGIHIEHNKRKAELLEFAGDTHFGITPEQVIKKITAYGFVQVYKKTFSGFETWHPEEDDFYIFFHKEKGILLRLETYFNRTSVNSINIYFNLQFNDFESRKFLNTTGGGSQHFHIDSYDLGIAVVVCSKDGREGLFNFLDAIDEMDAKFLSEWVESPFLWLLTYADTKIKGYDYKKINESIISQLPRYVQEAITPTMRREHEKFSQ